MTRRGLTLIETLMSLAISAMLLASVAVAFHASSQAVAVNDRFFRATQAARVAMGQMLHAVRTADAITVGTLAQQSKGSHADLFADVLTADGEMITYRYSTADRTLELVQRDQPDDPAFVLARNVESAIFTADIEPHPDSGLRRTVRLSIDLLVRIEGQQLRLSGSAVPRRAMVY